ncbi:MAG: hypothetical protein K2F59_03700 [Eubacteriales bacterium]|nr:hypothetical protein [Eubacteriales bacterium]
MNNLKVTRNLIISAFSSTKSGVSSLIEDNENAKQAGLGYLNQAMSLISTARILYYSDEKLVEDYSFDNLFIAFDEIISSSLESHREMKSQQAPLGLIEEKLKPFYKTFRIATKDDTETEESIEKEIESEN